MTEERLFITPPRPGAWLADGTDIGPGFSTVRERVPSWLTDKVASKILHTITMWRYGYVDEPLVIQIPMDWVPLHERPSYWVAKLFGCPVQLNPFISEAQVAVTIKEKPKR